MNIKNYTSTVEASSSMQKIEGRLVEIGASNINKRYNKDKVCEGILFLYYDPKIGQTLAFNLKADVEGCFKILYKDIKRPRPDTKATVMKQANKTAWKILADWVEIQCTMILLGQAEPLQMFLPYVYDTKEEKTFYEKVVEGKIKLLLSDSK